MTYLLDTNVLSEAIKPKPHAGVLARLKDPETVFSTAAIVWLELWQGYHQLPTGQRKSRVGEFLEGLRLSNMGILPYTQACAETQAQFASSLAATGRVLPLVDSMIAATAVTFDLTLVSRNVADFNCVPGLKLENWFV